MSPKLDRSHFEQQRAYFDEALKRVPGAKEIFDRILKTEMADKEIIQSIVDFNHGRQLSEKTTRAEATLDNGGRAEITWDEHGNATIGYTFPREK